MNLHLYVIGKIFQVVASNFDNLQFKKFATDLIAGEGEYEETETVQEVTEQVDYALYSFEHYHGKSEDELLQILATLEHFEEFRELRKQVQ